MHFADAETSRVFEANRADASVAFDVGLVAGRNRRGQVHEKGSLRVRFPNVAVEGLEAVLVNTAGGIAGGDRFDVSIDVGAGAIAVAGGAAAEKIYRSHGPAAELSLRLRVGPGARLAWLPQETILFDGAKLSRRIDVDLYPDSDVVVVEALIFGRAAMGETVRSGAVTDRWRVRRGGKLVFAETTRLDGDIAAMLARPAIGGGAGAVATILLAPGTPARIEAVRAVADQCCGEHGISAWNGIAVVRFVARDGLTLRHDLITILAALKAPLPRLWLQ